MRQILLIIIFVIITFLVFKDVVKLHYSGVLDYMVAIIMIIRYEIVATIFSCITGLLIVT